MSARAPKILPLLGVLAFGSLFCAPGVDRTGAIDRQSSSPAIRTAARSLRPMEVGDLRNGDGAAKNETKSTDESAREENWPLPDPEAWPGAESGEPVLETPEPDRLFHQIHRGENADRLRELYRLAPGRLDELNPGVDLESLETGQKVIVWRRDESTTSRSFGAPHWGWLRDGVPLPDGPNYRILYHHRTFGTYYTVSETRRALSAFFDRFSDSHDLMVGDISYRTGRHISPHRSHRSGRDVDVSYPRRGAPPDLERFHYVRRHELDAGKTLYLLRKFLEGGYVEHVFMDRWFQRKLLREARDQGAPEEWIDRVFEYPAWGSDAIVQHEPSHRNHMHIRFRCQPTDTRCR